MSRVINEAGKRYGRWLVVAQAKSNGKGARWICRCDCGNEGIIPGNRLRRGESQSCGCFVHELLSLPEGEASFNNLFGKMKHQAKRRGLEWRLTKEQVRILTKQNCHYCGAEPFQCARKPDANGDYIYSGLDRKNNKLGYVFENVVPCCIYCNAAKRERTVDEFQDWARSLCEHFVAKWKEHK